MFLAKYLQCAPMDVSNRPVVFHGPPPASGVSGGSEDGASPSVWCHRKIKGKTSQQTNVFALTNSGAAFVESMEEQKSLPPRKASFAEDIQTAAK